MMKVTKRPHKDDATVTLDDVAPAITVDKSVDPSSLAEPGGFFTFTVHDHEQLGIEPTQ